MDSYPRKALVFPKPFRAHTIISWHTMHMHPKTLFALETLCSD